MKIDKKTIGVARHSWKRIIFFGVRTYGIIKSFKFVPSIELVIASVEDVQEMLNDCTKRYFEVISKNGICHASTKLAHRMDELDFVLKSGCLNG